jgi:glutathione synthase/RimK-type ligase-like ATP-grasp enzyme
MIFIFSKSYNPTVGKLIDWLFFYNLSFKRIDDVIAEFDKIDFKYNFSSGKNESTDYYVFNKINLPFDFSLNQYLNNHLVYEYLSGFFAVVNRNKTIGNILQLHNIPKVTTLFDAKKFGILIPKTLVTNSKSELLEFYHENSQIITKSSHDLFNSNIDYSTYRSYTIKLNLDHIKSYSEKFGLSLFQENIVKKCDIKSFYFDGIFYSEAIFSQNDSQTEIDFRIYDVIKPSRTSSFKLPKTLEQKVKKLLKSYNLNFAVVDFVLDYNENLYFLEINVDGIFDAISENNNYNCEKILANFLYEEHNKTRN